MRRLGCHSQAVSSPSRRASASARKDVQLLEVRMHCSDVALGCGQYADGGTSEHTPAPNSASSGQKVVSIGTVPSSRHMLAEQRHSLPESASSLCACPLHETKSLSQHACQKPISPVLHAVSPRPVRNARRVRASSRIKLLTINHSW